MNTEAGIRLFLAGDVMTGRGIDQIMPQAVAPQLHESVVQSAQDYVRLAEQRNGPIPRQVEPSYIWGDALADLQRVRPHARIVNLETAITRSDDWQPKGINYRMHPANVACLRAAQIDVCALANNHVLDWGAAGLRETLATLREVSIKTAGAGSDALAACEPAIVPIAGNGRVLVFSAAHASSGIAPDWAATPDRPGIHLLADFTASDVTAIARCVAPWRQPGDIVVLSVHWGGNWGQAVPQEQQQWARALIDDAGVDVVHGHSSHHPKAVEVYRGKLILYGCGDLINDYEGISGYENYRGDLRLTYLPLLDAHGKLQSLTMQPYVMRRFSLQRAALADAEWLRAGLAKAGEKFHTGISRNADNSLQLHW